MPSKNLISDSSEWNFPLLKRFDKEIARIAHDEFGLDTYANQIEVISSEQMIDAYSSVGLPINYHHWSFGKQFVATEQTYRRGQMGLAYEIVINSDPCIAYLMEENTLPMQALVIAHACYGHNSFFKGNYLFRPGPAPTPSSTIWSLHAPTSPSARSATAMKRSNCCSTPATP
jgi:stage V sporulation protein R